MIDKAPIFISLCDNNCLVVGGNDYAADAAEFFLQFGAKVTVIGTELCPRLAAMDEAGTVRHIPRKFFRGDAANAYLCVAASGDRNTNIAVSVECKARHIPVHVEDPAEYGTFELPQVLTKNGLTVGLLAEDEAALSDLQETLDKTLSEIWPKG